MNCETVSWINSTFIEDLIHEVKWIKKINFLELFWDNSRIYLPWTKNRFNTIHGSRKIDCYFSSCWKFIWISIISNLLNSLNHLVNYLLSFDSSLSSFHVSISPIEPIRHYINFRVYVCSFSKIYKKKNLFLYDHITWIIKDFKD